MNNRPIAKLADAPWLRNDATQTVFECLSAIDAEARAVGGAIRNTLLGEDVNDIDIATTALPDQVIAAAENAGLKAVPTGYDHGTITVLSGGRPFEVTTLREDIETHGRHAVVRFGTDWQRDAQRRDFTMNALYAERDGGIIDLVGGYQDCLDRRVRFIGSAEKRIQEDYLRILRYFRFQATYGSGREDAEARHAIVANREGLKQLSAERVGQEMRRLLPARAAVPVVADMVDLGLVGLLTGSPPHQELFRHLRSLETVSDAALNASLLLFALVGFAQENIGGITDRLRLSNAEKDRMSEAFRAAGAVHKTATEFDLTRMLYRYGRQASVDGILIAWSRSADSALDAAWREVFDRASGLPIPSFPVTGADLVSNGIEPGELVGKKLRKGENTWIDSKFSLSRSEILEIILE